MKKEEVIVQYGLLGDRIPRKKHNIPVKDDDTIIPIYFFIVS